jgi:hypothetical protein
VPPVNFLFFRFKNYRAKVRPVSAVVPYLEQGKGLASEPSARATGNLKATLLFEVRGENEKG